MRRTSFPLVTLLLTVAILGVYGLELSGNGLAMCERFGFIAAHPTLGAALTSLFVHDPSGFAHVGGNVVFLLVFGAIVERAIGGVRFLALFAVAGVAGAALHVVVDPGSTVPLVGCSGALCGLFAFAGVLRPALLGFVAAFIGLNVVEVLTGTGGSIAVGDHLGGFAFGTLVVALARLSGERGARAALARCG